MADIISVHSYRGGTGKSNVTANLITILAMQGRRVAVIDTDIQSPGIHMIFGWDEQGISKTLNDYLWKRSPIEDAAYDVSDKAGITGTGKIFLVPSSMNSNEIARILSQGYDFGHLHDGFRQLIRSLNLDYLFIDTHPGLNKETLLSIAVANLVLFVLRPDRQDFQGTAVTIDVARQLQVRQMMLIINKVLPSMDRVALRQQVETTYGVPLAGILPLSEDMVQLGSKGIFCLEYPDHPFGQELRRVAMQITEGMNQ